MPHYWISFVDRETDDNIGCCVVETEHMDMATGVAKLHGCNPGGEARVIEIPEECLREITELTPVNKLWQIDELTAMGNIIVDADTGELLNKETIQ